MWRLFSIARSVFWKIRRPITVGARCAVLDGNRILLVRHTYQDGWLIPGGGVKKGETLREAACREILEECGIEIDDAKLFHVYYSDRQSKSDHIALFMATSFHGVPAISDVAEIAEVTFFPVDALPERATPATRRRVEELRSDRPLSDRW